MIELICLTIISPIALIIAHALAIRLITFLKRDVSNQKLLLYCIALFNLPVLAILSMTSVGRTSGLIVYAYALITFNSFAYFYFHVFNMSETARRIKLLVGIKKGKLKNANDLTGYYDDKKALMLRLERLEQLSQVKKAGNNVYSLKSRLFSNVYFLVLLFRRILGFSDV
jgi:uncharacterized membrane protein